MDDNKGRVEYNTDLIKAGKIHLSLLSLDI